jgi:hypothetical protein
MHINIRYWLDRQLQIYLSVNTFGVFVNRRHDDGRWGHHLDLIHFRIENLKGNGG